MIKKMFFMMGIVACLGVAPTFAQEEVAEETPVKEEVPQTAQVESSETQAAQ